MVSLFLVSLVTAFGPPAAPSAATVTHSGADYTLANGFVQVVFATTGAHGTQLRSLKGDFAGAGNYGEVRRIGLADVPAAHGICFYWLHGTACVCAFCCQRW